LFSIEPRKKRTKTNERCSVALVLSKCVGKIASNTTGRRRFSLMDMGNVLPLCKEACIERNIHEHLFQGGRHGADSLGEGKGKGRKWPWLRIPEGVIPTTVYF
jgi:hypothetical protein